MKYFLLIFSCCGLALPAAVQKTPTNLEENSIKSYLDPISLATNELSLGPSLTYNKTGPSRVYSGGPGSPYYSPQTSLARQDYFDAVDSYGVPVSAPLAYHDNTDSYGVPVSDPLVYDTGPEAPLASIYDYPEYVQYYDPELVVPDYSVLTETETEAPVYSPVTEFPAYEYEYPLEEPEPEIDTFSLILLACLCVIFLWPGVIYIDRGDINSPDRRVETEETTMMTTPMMTTLMTTMIPREFYDAQQQPDNSQECNVFCHVRQSVARLGQTFLNLEDR